jgi:beta-ureidopropionase
MRKIKLAGIQTGTYPGNYEKNWMLLAQKTEKLILQENPYFITYPEMMTSPYFATIKDEKYFSFAEFINGSTVKRIVDLSITFDVHILGTLFEKSIENEQINYYNTAFICSPTRGFIGNYRNVHLPKLQNTSFTADEKFHFEQLGDSGKKFPIFTLDNEVKIGILIGFDCTLPEAWKSLRLQNVDVVVVLSTTIGFKQELFTRELQVKAMKNNVFVLNINKGGTEQLPEDRIQREHFGCSCLINPRGQIITIADGKEWSFLVGQIDISERKKATSL